MLSAEDLKQETKVIELSSPSANTLLTSIANVLKAGHLLDLRVYANQTGGVTLEYRRYAIGDVRTDSQVGVVNDEAFDRLPIVELDGMSVLSAIRHIRSIGEFPAVLYIPIEKQEYSDTMRRLAEVLGIRIIEREHQISSMMVVGTVKDPLHVHSALFISGLYALNVPGENLEQGILSDG